MATSGTSVAFMLINLRVQTDFPQIVATPAMPWWLGRLLRSFSYFLDRSVQIDTLASEKLGGQIIRKINLVFLTDAVREFSSH